MQLTHAIYFKDNWDGEGDKFWMLAYFERGVFYSETGEPVIKYVGDEVLKAIPLDSTDAMAAIEAAKVEATIDTLEKVGEYLKYEYEGVYDLSSIESFFDDKAEELKVKV